MWHPWCARCASYSRDLTSERETTSCGIGSRGLGYRFGGRRKPCLKHPSNGYTNTSEKERLSVETRAFRDSNSAGKVQGPICMPAAWLLCSASESLFQVPVRVQSMQSAFQ